MEIWTRNENLTNSEEHSLENRRGRKWSFHRDERCARPLIVGILMIWVNLKQPVPSGGQPE